MLLRTVEWSGCWPRGLRGNQANLLPKPGGAVENPLDRRPITLLPAMYRLWARLRLPDVECWRAVWDPAVREAAKGAEGQAWQLAWDAAAAQSQGLGFAEWQQTSVSFTIRCVSRCSVASFQQQSGLLPSLGLCSMLITHPVACEPGMQ